MAGDPPGLVLVVSEFITEHYCYNTAVLNFSPVSMTKESDCKSNGNKVIKIKCQHKNKKKSNWQKRDR